MVPHVADCKRFQSQPTLGRFPVPRSDDGAACSPLDRTTSSPQVSSSSGSNSTITGVSVSDNTTGANNPLSSGSRVNSRVGSYPDSGSQDGALFLGASTPASQAQVSSNPSPFASTSSNKVGEMRVAWSCPNIRKEDKAHQSHMCPACPQSIAFRIQWTLLIGPWARMISNSLCPNIRSRSQTPE